MPLAENVFLLNPHHHHQIGPNRARAKTIGKKKSKYVQGHKKLPVEHTTIDLSEK
jgi:hypothetical protein